MFNRNAVLFAAFAAASFSVSAQTPAIQPATKPAPVSREAARIVEINERIAVMSAQLAELEMQAKIASKRSEINKVSEVGPVFGMEENFIPSVKEINGIDGRIWAVLYVQGGNTQTVRVGDRVGSWRVTEILSDSVKVKRGSDAIRLSFGFNTQQPQAAGVPSQLGLPPFPSR